MLWFQIRGTPVPNVRGIEKTKYKYSRSLDTSAETHGRWTHQCGAMDKAFNFGTKDQGIESSQDSYFCFCCMPMAIPRTFGTKIPHPLPAREARSVQIRGDFFYESEINSYLVLLFWITLRLFTFGPELVVIRQQFSDYFRSVPY